MNSSAPGTAPPSGAPAGSAPPGQMLPQGPFVDLATEPMPAKAILLVAPVTTFFIIALVCIGLRLWSKRIKKTSLRFSDYSVLVAAVFAAGYLTLSWLTVERGGVGFPLALVAPEQRSFTQKSFVVAWLIQAWANTFVRLSILDLVWQIFAVKKFRMIVYFFEGCAIAYLVGCTVTFFTICRPLKYNFVLGPQALEHCGNLNLKFLLSAIFNLVLDVCILILPMPMLWNLQLNERKKLALTFVFSLGIFVCFATAWRTYNVIEFSKPESKMNFTITVVEDALWSGLEINLGVINACLPTMPPALQRIFKTPYLRLLSFSTRRPSKPSKCSSDSDSGDSRGSSALSSWKRLGGVKNEKYMISRETEFSVDIESGSMNQIPTDNMGSTTRLTTPSPLVHHYPNAGTNRYLAVNGRPQPQFHGQDLAPEHTRVEAGRFKSSI